jgi:hypothetical protein
MMVSAAVANALQATMSEGESLKLVFNLDELEGYFTLTVVKHA